MYFSPKGTDFILFFLQILFYLCVWVVILLNDTSFHPKQSQADGIETVFPIFTNMAPDLLPLIKSILSSRLPLAFFVQSGENDACKSQTHFCAVTQMFPFKKRRSKPCQTGCLQPSQPSAILSCIDFWCCFCTPRTTLQREYSNYTGGYSDINDKTIWPTLLGPCQHSDMYTVLCVIIRQS